jgi:rhamnosyl/mannosyltransferase
MRALQVYRDYFADLPGGIERHVLDLATGLDVGEVEIAVGSRNRGSGSTEGMRVHRVREYGRPGGVPLTPSLVRVMRSSAYDLVHVHSPDPSAEFALALVGETAGRILTYHTDIDRGSRWMPAYSRLLNWVLDRCDRVIASSDELVERSPVLSRLVARRPASLAVVPFGVDLERFTPGPSAEADDVRRSWGDGPIVLFMGRLRYYKGIPYLIRAMRDVPGKLVIAGDGPERDRIHAQARAELGDRAILLPGPSESELADLYRAADVFCLPSISHAEAFGLAAVEAMASGKPVVTTEIGTATSVINQHEVTGFVVEPSDERMLAEGLRTLVEDDSLARRMGEAARLRAVQHYDRRVMLARIASMYRGLVEQRKVGRRA